MNTINKYPFPTYNLYNLEVQPTYPVDIVKMAYRQPNVTLPNKGRIEELEERTKELETLTLELQQRLTLAEATIDELRLTAYLQDKK